MTVSEIPANVSARHSYKKSRVNMLKDPARMLGSLIRMRIAHRRNKPRTPKLPVEKKTEDTVIDAIVEPKRTSTETSSKRRTLQR